MSLINRINTKIDEFNFSYYGVMATSLFTGSAVASVALIAILVNDAPIWQLALICCVAMASNAASIAHSPLRWVVWTFILNVIISLILFLINIF